MPHRARLVLQWGITLESQVVHFYCCLGRVFILLQNTLFCLVCLCITLPESTRIYGENTENRQEEAVCTKFSIVVMLFHRVMLCYLLFMNKRVDAFKVVVALEVVFSP